MVVIAVIVTLLLCMGADYLIRTTLERRREQQVKKEREEALATGLRLEIASDVTSLKRVEVPEPKARILAVDDESIVLDSLRKILVLDGFSVDTVESGPEALALVGKNQYDFVFTDLRMPGMDGIEVTKAVKHLRPDIDVIIVTAYASIDSAVETMKFGAMDYIQKPFTDDELTQFVGRALIRRDDRIQKALRPKIHLITQSQATGATGKHDFNVASGVFVSAGHTWASIKPNGALVIGLDDFIQRIIGSIESIQLPFVGQSVKRGETLFSLSQGGSWLAVPSPVSGKVTSVNNALAGSVGIVQTSPFEAGWICHLEPTQLAADLRHLKIGEEAAAWYELEVDRYMEVQRTANSNPATAVDDSHWRLRAARRFLGASSDGGTAVSRP